MPNNFSNFSSAGLKRISARLAKYIRNDRWVGANNRYVLDCVKKIHNDCKPSVNRLKQTQVADYIAASIPLHCMDGWGFFGRALICEVLGDSDEAKHFAYYAELRAAMSILGFGGIGIFDKEHFEIDNSANLSTPIRSGGTHVAVKSGLNCWINSTDSCDVVQNIIRPAGIPLRDWLAELSAGSSAWITKGLLSDWGYDINNLTDDRDARNTSSYRPNRLGDRKSIGIDQAAALLINVWQMSVPANNGGMSIDLFLLKKSIENYYKSVAQKKSKNKIENILDRLNIIEPQKSRILDILLKPASDNFPLILKESFIKGRFNSARYSVQMLSRAFLLLRIATGVSMKLMEDNHLDKNDIEFWWRPLGYDHGLWDAAYADPLSDMWTDVEDALNRIQSNYPLPTYLKNRIDNAQDILTLGGCERVGLSRICL